MREREEVEFAWRYRRWRALILATRGRESQGGRGELDPEDYKACSRAAVAAHASAEVSSFFFSSSHCTPQTWKMLLESG